MRGIETLDITRPLEVDAALEPLEAGRTARLVERHDLTVEQDRGFQRAGQRRERVDDRRKLAGLVVAEARPDPDVGTWLTGRDVNQPADAVVFRLVEQAGLHQGRVSQGRQHRSHRRRVITPLHQELPQPNGPTPKVRKYRNLFVVEGRVLEVIISY